MKYAYVSAEKAKGEYTVTQLCRAFRISTSGYYASLKREPSVRAKKDIELRVLVRTSFEQSRRTYGSIRIHEDLVEAGEHVGRNRIIRIMQEDGIRARVRRRFKCTTMSEHDQPVAANVLDRKFEASAPNRRWVGDTTEMLTTSGGKFYLAAIIDLYARFCVGWAVSAVNDRHLTMRALEMAIRRRCPQAGLLHHSDQGSTYASEDYRDMLQVHGITCSMSRRGNCLDNAAMESWFSTVSSSSARPLSRFTARRSSCSTT
ncbi:MAG: IS3 family transposase [Kofleriaceae bacterium]